MKLVDIIHPSRICTDLKSKGKMDVLAELGELLAEQGDDAKIQSITKTLVDRERLATTGVGHGVAIPHGKIEGLKSIVAAVGISRTGVPFDAVDDKAVHIFIALIAPLNSSGDHLRFLARISRLLKSPDIRARFIEAHDAEELFDMIDVEDGKHS
ncbi:MAG: PTS sugar transporter subunit IIA [Deltaproteobacteria bacterium]|nr:PTS sugar transporter subunit IIA [Deltaproteobacteria bacterium]